MKDNGKNHLTPAGFMHAHAVAEFMGVSVRTVRTWCKKRIVPYYKLGHFVYFKQADLIATIELNKIESEPKP